MQQRLYYNRKLFLNYTLGLNTFGKNSLQLDSPKSDPVWQIQTVPGFPSYHFAELAALPGYLHGHHPLIRVFLGFFRVT